MREHSKYMVKGLTRRFVLRASLMDLIVVSINEGIEAVVRESIAWINI